MKTIVFVAVVLALVVAVPFTVLAEPRGACGGQSTYVVQNPSHLQHLGGWSTHAWIGLSRACQHSPKVQDPPSPPSDGKGSTGQTGGATK